MPVFAQTSAAAAAAAAVVCLQPTRLLAVVIAKNTVGSSWRKTLGTRWVVCGWRRAVLQGRQAATLHRTVGKRESSQSDKMDCGCVAAYTRQCPVITAGVYSMMQAIVRPQMACACTAAARSYRAVPAGQWQCRHVLQTKCSRHPSPLHLPKQQCSGHPQAPLLLQRAQLCCACDVS
jgi:hypothetical protein